jgi:hypothetical protein
MQAITESSAVNWYYANNGQQTGPISEAELDSLAVRGTVTPTTLVWREGMPQWQPYRTVHQPVAATPSPLLPPIIQQSQCVECQRGFPQEDLLRYENVFVCAACKPAFFQKLREGVATGVLGGLWRSGKLLVLRRETQLPDHCTKCNKPANGFRLRRNLSWHAPWLLILLISPIIYVIVAVIVSKRAKIQIGLCPEHRRTRARDLLIAWLIFASSVAAFVLSAVLSNGWYMLIGIGLLLVSAIYGSVRVPMVQAKRIDDQFVWLNGVSDDYRRDLPEFTGRN